MCTPYTADHGGDGGDARLRPRRVSIDICVRLVEVRKTQEETRQEA